jgi:hypothetical protein
LCLKFEHTFTENYLQILIIFITSVLIRKPTNATNHLSSFIAEISCKSYNYLQRSLSSGMWPHSLTWSLCLPLQCKWVLFFYPEHGRISFIRKTIFITTIVKPSLLICTLIIMKMLKILVTQNSGNWVEFNFWTASTWLGSRETSFDITAKW